MENEKIPPDQHRKGRIGARGPVGEEDTIEPVERSKNGNWATGGLRLVFLLSVLAFPQVSLPSAARDYPPSVPPPVPYQMPVPAVKRLPNGLRVVSIERRNLPMVTVRLIVCAGAESDPPDLPGLAAMTAGIITEGTNQHSERQIADLVDSSGGMQDSGADWDYSYLSLSFLSDKTDLAFSLAAEITIHPIFAAAEVERGRRQTLSALQVAFEDPSFVADEVVRKLLFAGTPYGHPSDGTAEAVRKMRLEDLRHFHNTYYVPSNSVLAVVGDLATPKAFALAEKYFGGWQDGRIPPLPAFRIEPISQRQIVVIDKPDAVQTEIRIGSAGVAQGSPDFTPLSVADQILGGPAENRLFKALRSKQALTYGASSELVCRRAGGAWISKTFTRTSETVRSLRLALDQIRDLADHKVGSGSLDSAISYLVGHLALDFESSSSVATRVLLLMLNDLPLGYWNNYPAQLRGLNTEEVWQVTQKYLKPDQSVIVLVGNAAGFEKDLKKVGQFRIIPLRDLDLGSAEMTGVPASKRFIDGD